MSLSAIIMGIILFFVFFGGVWYGVGKMKKD